MSRIAKRPNPSRAVERAARRYRLTHWGLGGAWKERPATFPDPKAEVPTVMGLVKEIVYETTKAGEGGPSEYQHAFKAPFPVLAFNAGGLLIGRFEGSRIRSRYRVTWRGIVG